MGLGYILVVKSMLSGLKDLGSIPRAQQINKTSEKHQKSEYKGKYKGKKIKLMKNFH